VRGQSPPDFSEPVTSVPRGHARLPRGKAIRIEPTRMSGQELSVVWSGEGRERRGGGERFPTERAWRQDPGLGSLCSLPLTLLGPCSTQKILTGQIGN
jgi:hypothetical protein